MSIYGSKYFNDVVFVNVGIDIIKYHGLVIMVIVFILGLVGYIGVFLLCRSLSYRHHSQWENLEYGWTVLPIILLALLWGPSINNLYHIDDINTPQWTFNAVASQWYWNYEFHLLDQQQFEFQSYIAADSGADLDNGGYRLLDVDWRIVVPAQTQVTMYVASTDVLHSFSLPSVLLNVDAIPGRVNQLPCVFGLPGVYYGQCSEICGINHSFIPIVIEVIPANVFIGWLEGLTNLLSN